MRLIWMREPLRCYSSRFVVVYVSSWIMSILPCSVWTNLSRHSRLLIRLRNVFGLAVDTTLQCFLACEALRYVLHCQILISPLSTDFTSNLPQGDVTAGWLCSRINEQVAPWLYWLLPNPLRPIWDVLRIKNSALNTSYLSCMIFFDFSENCAQVGQVQADRCGRWWYMMIETEGTGLRVVWFACRGLSLLNLSSSNFRLTASKCQVPHVRIKFLV